MTDEPSDGRGRNASNQFFRDRGDARSSWTNAITLVRTIAGAERSQNKRRYTTSRRKLAVVITGLAVLLPLFGGILRGSYGLGTRVVNGSAVGLLDLAMWYLPVVVGMYLLVGVVQSDASVLSFGARELHLTTVPDRILAIGLLLVDIRTWFIVFICPSTLVIASFALGTGSATVGVAGTAAVAAVMFAVLLWGYVLGLVGRLAWQRFDRIDVSSSLFQVVGILGIGLVFGIGGVFAGSLSAELEGGSSLLTVAPDGPPPIPFGHYAEFLFVGTPLLDTVSATAIASGMAVVVSIPIGIEATARLAPRLWHSDSTPSSPGDADDSTTESATVRSTDRDWPWLKTPSGYVADGVVRRAFRTPERLAHVSYYLLILGIVVAGSLANPSLLARQLGLAFVLLGIWLAGGAVGLNPIGEEGPMLKQIVLSEFPPRTFVRGRIVAGVALGSPFVLVGTAVLTRHDYSLLNTVAAGAVWLALIPVSGAIAVGVGTLLPRSEPGTFLDNDVPTPGMLAVLAHGSVTALLAILGGSFALDTVSVPRPRLTVGLVGLGSVLAADVCYRFATDGIAGYGRPRRPDSAYVVELMLGVSFLGFLLSVTLPRGLRTIAGTTGRVESLVTLTAGALGAAVAGGIYLLASGRSRSFVDFEFPSRTDLPSLVVGLAVSGIVAVGVTATELTHATFPAELVSSRLSVTGDAAGLAGVGIVVLLAASTEFLFRNVVQNRLTESISAPQSVLVTTAFFTLVHAPLTLGSALVVAAVTLATLFSLALIWGWLYQRSESILVPILCHACFSVVVLLT